MENSLIHGDFFLRNVVYRPEKLTFIDFERAEMDIEGDRLGMVWVSAMCGYFIEFIYKACATKSFTTKTPEGLGVISMISKLNTILSTCLKTHSLFSFGKDYKGIMINPSVWEKWIISVKEEEVLRRGGLQELFKACFGSNFRIKPPTLEEANITKASAEAVVFALLEL